MRRGVFSKKNLHHLTFPEFFLLPIKSNSNLESILDEDGSTDHSAKMSRLCTQPSLCQPVTTLTFKLKIESGLGLKKNSCPDELHWFGCSDFLERPTVVKLWRCWDE